MPFRSATPDRLLRRFQRTGDPAALGDLFDRTAPELLRVAAWLCGNRADAEDLLQRTFVTVIEARERFDARRRALPWLCGILGNHSKKLQDARSRGTTPPREHATTSAVDVRARDPAAVAADAEFAAAVAALRRELGPPYREVLDLHLGEGLNGKEIAQRLGRPAGTVRTQLVRALEMLRRRLPHGFVAGVVAAATCDAAQLAGVKAAVLATARHGATLAPAGAGATATATLLTGGVVMGKKAFAFVPVLALLLGVALWAGWPAAAAAEPHATVPVPASGTLADRDAALARAEAPPGPAAPARTAVAPLATNDDPGFATVRVTVRWQDDGSPAQRVGVRALDPVSYLFVLRSESVTDADGVAELRHLRPGRWWIVCSHGGDEHVDVVADQREAIELTAERTGTLRGRVVDPDGRPVGGATVWSSSDGASSQAYQAARSDAGGWFDVPWATQHSLHARKDGYAPSDLYSRRVDPGTTVELRLRPDGASLRGRVVDARGLPVRWAKVQMGPEEAYSTGAREVARGEVLVTGADGAFTATGIASFTEVRAWAAGHGMWHEQLRAAPGEQLELTIPLADAAIAHGVVRDEDGKPVAGAAVWFGEPSRRVFGALRAVADAEGRFALGDLPAGEVELHAGKGPLRAAATLSLRAGERTEWNPVIGSGPTVTGVVVDESARPLPGLRVAALQRHEVFPGRGCDTDAAGRFVLTQVGETPVDVLVLQRDLQLRSLHGVAPGTRDLVVRIRQRDLPSATLRARVLDESGRPVTAWLNAWRDGVRTAQDTAADAATGAVSLGPMPADAYDVTVWTHEHGQLPCGRIALEPDATRDLGDLVLRAPGRVEITLHDQAGRPIDEVQTALWSPTGQQTANVQFERGRATVAPVQPGRHFVRASAGRDQVAWATVDVRSGETTTVALETRSAARVVLRFRDPAAVPGLTVRVRAFAPDGTLAAILRTFAENAEPLRQQTSFAPGRYELECTASDGRTATAALHVAAPDQPVELAIDLPAR